MSKADYFVSILYADQSIEFWIQLPSNTNLEKFEKELREELYIEIEKEED